MAIFDLAQRRLCVRIVYDGPAGSGKTTNVRQLAAAFASQRWGELETPGDVAGRTLWFDWLEIRAGVVCGQPLVCQVITVPGQVALTPRRRKLLETADVVVFVCESGPAAVDETRAALALVDDLHARDTQRAPRLLQTNKQDRADARDPARVARDLGWDGPHVLGAIASEGVGVVDTFVAAVRVLSRALEDRIASTGMRLHVGRAEGARSMLAKLQATAIDPEGAAEMLLQEAAASLVAAPPSPRADARPLGGRRDVRSPVLPDADVPTGFVWPAHTGRSTLRALGESRAPGTTVRLDATGQAVLSVDGRVAQTSARERFDDVDAARQALVHAARERTQLEGLLVVGTVLAVREDRDGGFWLWRVAPELAPWRPRLEAAPAGSPERNVLVEGLAVAVALGVAVGVRHRLALATSIEGFGFQADVLRYGGALVPSPAADRDAVDLVARATDAVAALGVPRATFAAAVSRELERRLDGDAARAVTAALEVRAA